MFGASSSNIRSCSYVLSFPGPGEGRQGTAGLHPRIWDDMLLNHPACIIGVVSSCDLVQDAVRNARKVFDFVRTRSL